jgi:hypothetical protein
MAEPLQMASSQTLFETQSTSNPSHTVQRGFAYKSETMSSVQTFSTRPIQKASAGNSGIRNKIRPPDLGSNIGNAKLLHNNVAGSKRKRNEPSFHRSPSDEFLGKSWYPGERPTGRQAATSKIFRLSGSNQAPPIRSTPTIQQHSTNRGQLTPSPAVRAHYRESSLSSSDSVWPASRYTQSTLERQVVGDTYHDVHGFQPPRSDILDRTMTETYVGELYRSIV